MSKALNLEQLRRMPKSNLIKEHDKQAKKTVVGINYYLDELKRREQMEYTNSIRRYTIAIAIMTLVMLGSTIINIFV